MTKNIIIVFLLVLDICMMAFFLHYIKEEGINKRQQYVYQNIAYDYRKLIQADSSRMILQNIDIVNTHKQKEVIDSVLRKNPILVIRYSSLSCHTCIDSVVNKARLLSQTLGRENICIFANYHSDSDFKVFWRTNNNYFRIYSVVSAIKRIDKFNTPYMFVLNNDKTISHLFIPHKEIPEMTKWYLDVVQQYLMEHN
ncbi:MAG: hypothetical protein J6T70_17130 [Bacteroidales bacterium]|nr:hypothetical protein [Bacteroidales bacterium]